MASIDSALEKCKGELEGNEEFQKPDNPDEENPLVAIGDKLCPGDEEKGICNGQGACKLGMCLVILR